MRILHVVPSYLPARRYGGPIYSVHGLCKALAARGHDVHVFTTSVDGPGDSDVPLGQPVSMDSVKVWYFPSTHLRRLFWSPAMAKALARQLPDFDVVHLHSVFLWPTWAAARVARRCDIPYVLAPRGMLVKELIRRKSRWVKTAWIHLIEKRNLEHAAFLHLTSPAEQRELNRFPFRWPTLVQIPNGIDEPPPAPAITSASSSIQAALSHRPAILFLGRVHWKKGVDRLIQALAHLPAPHLIVAGNDEENYLPSLNHLARELHVEQRVHFVGAVHGTDKEVLLRHTDLLVLPSTYSENFGNVALEAMIRHCPVVVSPEVGLADWIQDTGCGTIATTDPPALARAISHCFNHPAETHAMAIQAAESARRFTWNTVASKMESNYRPLLRAGSGTSHPASLRKKSTP